MATALAIKANPDRAEDASLPAERRIRISGQLWVNVSTVSGTASRPPADGLIHRFSRDGLTSPEHGVFDDGYGRFE